MHKARTQLLLVFIGVFLFNFLFWQENFGANTLIFTLFYLAALWLLFPKSRKTRGFMLTAGGALLTALMVVWHNSGAAKFAWLISAMCAAGFAQEHELRFVFSALRQYLWGWWQSPRHFFETLNPGTTEGTPRERSFRRSIGLAFVPLLVVFVFYFLYYFANDKFAALSDAFWRQVGNLLVFDISVPHLLFVIFGFFMVGAAFWRNDTSLAKTDLAAPDELQRVRPPRKRYFETLEMLGLRREYRQAILLFWMLNALLLVVNLTDIRYVWFGFDEAAQQDLKGYVHKGTYFLIASILLAMAVLFYVFRKNLNFLPRNKNLKTAAGIWLIQNAVLAISVCVRNGRYIDFHGLAYKRIGVILFLALVFFGLITLWHKIRDCRTMSWLWRQNGWAFYTLLLLNACISWDVLITRYNLSSRPKGAIDVQYMINEVSDKNLFLLEENFDSLAQKEMYPIMAESDIRRGIERKRQIFNVKMRDISWKSWNGTDARNQLNSPSE